MSEVLEIEVDGEIDDHGSFDGDRSSPRWGLPLAVGVAGALLLAVLLVVVIPTVTSGGQSRQAAQPGRDSAQADAAAIVEDAEHALAAWGRFAVSGDLEHLDGSFVPDGPQRRLLAGEAPRLAASPPGPPAYAVSLSKPTVVSVSGRRATLRGDVTWIRAGDVAQHYRWEMILHRRHGRWLLWTLATPENGPPAGDRTG